MPFHMAFFGLNKADKIRDKKEYAHYYMAGHSLGAAMAGVYTTSVTERTLDEAPAAYKSVDDIIGPIAASVDVLDVMRPIYNFKAQ